MAQITEYKPLDDEASTLSVEKRAVWKTKKTFFNFLLKILLDIS